MPRKQEIPSFHGISSWGRHLHPTTAWVAIRTLTFLRDNQWSPTGKCAVVDGRNVFPSSCGWLFMFCLVAGDCIPSSYIPYLFYVPSISWWSAEMILMTNLLCQHGLVNSASPKNGNDSGAQHVQLPSEENIGAQIRGWMVGWPSKSVRIYHQIGSYFSSTTKVVCTRKLLIYQFGPKKTTGHHDLYAICS